MSERHHTPKVFIAGGFKALGKREIYKLSVGSTLPNDQGSVLPMQYNVIFNISVGLQPTAMCIYDAFSPPGCYVELTFNRNSFSFLIAMR